MNHFGGIYNFQFNSTLVVISDFSTSQKNIQFHKLNNFFFGFKWMNRLRHRRHSVITVAREKAVRIEICACVPLSSRYRVQNRKHVCTLYTEFNSTSIRFQFQNQHFIKCRVPFYSIITEIYAQITFIITIIIISLIIFCSALQNTRPVIQFHLSSVYGVYFELKTQLTAPFPFVYFLFILHILCAVCFFSSPLQIYSLLKCNVILNGKHSVCFRFSSYR